MFFLVLKNHENHINYKTNIIIKLYLLCGVYFIFQNGDSAHVLRIFDEEAQAVQSVHNSKRMLADSIFRTKGTLKGIFDSVIYSLHTQNRISSAHRICAAILH